MRIVILNYHRLGGSGIVAYEIGRVMAEEKRHEVYFLGLEPPFRFKNNFMERMHFHKIWIHEYPVFNFPPYTLALASQLSELIQTYNIDVIHSHYALPHAVAALLSRDISGRKIKCVTTLHGTDITVVGAHPSIKMITRYAIERSDVVTAVSDFLKKETEKIFDITPGKIRRVYNFVNPNDFNPNLKTADNNDNKFIIMHMSNLRPVRRPSDVIRIFHKLNKIINKKLELWVVGCGPSQPEMKNLACSLGIGKYVKFLGIVNTVGSLIAQADLMVLPGRQESFGLAALESMACGVPVVAARAAGLPEVIEDDFSGFLFDPENLDEAAEKSRIVLIDSDVKKRICENAFLTASQKFNYSSIIQEWERIYSE